MCVYSLPIFVKEVFGNDDFKSCENKQLRAGYIHFYIQSSLLHAVLLLFYV